MSFKLIRFCWCNIHVIFKISLMISLREKEIIDSKFSDRLPSRQDYLPQYSLEKIQQEQIASCPFREKVVCSICLSVFSDPRTLNCGHTYCWDCIKDWVKAKRDCPQCKSKVTNINKIKKNVMVNDLIDDLPVNCPSHEYDTLKRCKETLTVRQLEKHWNSCPYIQFECKCKALILSSKYLESSTTCNCPYMACKYCNCQYQERLIRYHTDCCKREEAKCKLCGNFYGRGFKEEHEKNECFSFCPYREYGCEQPRMSGKNVEAHLKEAENEHKLLLLKKTNPKAFELLTEKTNEINNEFAAGNRMIGKVDPGNLLIFIDITQ